MNESLLKKLRMQESHRKLIVGAPDTYREALGSFGEHAALPAPAAADDFELPPQRFDFVQWFVTQSGEVREHMAAIKESASADALLWICYPKRTSKVKSDLNRDTLWQIVSEFGLEGVALVSVDDTWSAMRFRPAGAASSKRTADKTGPGAARLTDKKERSAEVPDAIAERLRSHPAARETFDKLAYSHKKEYVEWIMGAKKEETRMRRLDKMTAMLEKGLKRPSDKEG